MKLLAMAVSAVVIVSTAAQADSVPTVYGKGHASVDHVNYDETARDDYWQVERRASCLGVKGSEQY